MTEQQDHALNELGLPRANSNGVFILTLILLGVFGVMAYSCTQQRKGHGNGLSSPPQPLTGNEWFVGKASGLEIPTPIPTSTPVINMEPPVRRLHVGAQPSTKKLGGKVFADLPSSADHHNTVPESDDSQIGDVASFTARSRTTKSSRPEYYLERDVELPVSDFEVKAGTTIPAQLDIAINSDLGGPAVAHITRTIYDSVTGQFPLVPPGTKLYGNIDPNVIFGQTRVDVVWQRLIFPNGASLVIDNMRASDPAGQVGLNHTVDNHFDRLFGGAALLSAISAGVQLSQPQQSASFGTAPSVGQTLAGALGQNLGQVGTEFIRRQMNVKPTIIIPNAEYFTVVVNKDMVFPGPYGEWEQPQ